VIPHDDSGTQGGADPPDDDPLRQPSMRARQLITHQVTSVDRTSLVSTQVKEVILHEDPGTEGRAEPSHGLLPSRPRDVRQLITHQVTSVDRTSLVSTQVKEVIPHEDLGTEGGADPHDLSRRLGHVP
jgi:type II secretory pathway component GspD/PulD (secretin)